MDGWMDEWMDGGMDGYVSRLEMKPTSELSNNMQGNITKWVCSNLGCGHIWPLSTYFVFQGQPKTWQQCAHRYRNGGSLCNLALKATLLEVLFFLIFYYCRCLFRAALLVRRGDVIRSKHRTRVCVTVRVVSVVRIVRIPATSHALLGSM